MGGGGSQFRRGNRHCGTLGMYFVGVSMCTQLRLFDNAELRYHDANNSRVKHFAKTHIRKARVKRNCTQCLSTYSKLFILSGINPNILKKFKDNVNSCIP